MVRRTLLLFVGFVLLVLAVTVGYTLLGLSGPRTAIESAEAAAAEGRHAEAVRLLDIAERTLTAREQSDLLPAILQLRFRAHRKLGNVPAARRDLEDLLALRGRAARDSALLVAYAEVLLAAGEPEEALDVVTGALPDASGADHARLLELAGEAHQALYQRGISRLMKKLEENLSDAARQRAVAYLRTALYRTADDPVAVRALAMLRETLRRSAATPIGYAAFERDIADVRAG
ncbi:MAG TPA: hypothetical protein VK081_04980, partial [Planctomycetota bacterium]|nr:hypothetical protein [Planctomycetota bacterium]